MTYRSNYGEWPALEQFYLEDSYVLEIVERPAELAFRMEFVLRERHPRYHAPLEGHHYCYARGELTFRGATDIRWVERRDVISFDATGEFDLGNIDFLFQEDGRFVAGGDWGLVNFAAGEVVVTLNEADSA